jgi:GTPase SAR1 family protein
MRQSSQDKFRAITQNYYKGANGIILIYDINCMRSFNNIRNWLSSIKNSSPENIQVILLGNKIDFAELREVARDEEEKIAK